jgi:hypothetical protein
MARQLTIEIAIEKTRAQQEARELEQGLKNLEQAAIKTGTATDKQAAAHEGLSRRLADAKTRTRELEAEKKKLAATTDQTAKASGLLTSAVLRYASAGAVIAAVKWTADWADRIEELSKATGLSITMIQKLDQITKQNGTTIEALTKSFASMQDRVAGGDKSAVRAFEKLGISFETFKRMRPDDQMEMLAIAVGKIEDPMLRVNVVTDLFGKTGVQLIPTLERIADGMDDIKTASEENILAIGQLSDGWEDLKGMGARLMVEAIGPLVKGMSSSATVTDYLTGRFEAMAVMAGRLNPLLKTMSDYLPANSKVLIGGDPDYGSMPEPVDPEHYRPLPGADSGGLPAPLAFEEMLKIGREITADVERQIAARTANKSKVAETTTALREQLSVMDMQAQRMSDISTFFGFKPKNFAWEDYNPMPGAPSVPGADGANNAQNILNPYFGNVANPSAPGANQRPSFWNRQGQGFNQMQADWRQQNFGSAQGWMNSAMGWGSQLADISENGDPLVNATNVRGRGKRAAMGALKGAEIGGRFGGPYGAAGGALVGLIVGAFRNPAFEDVWNRIAKNFGVEVSDELAKRIADRAKTDYKNNRGAAEVRSLGDILGETGGVNADNVKLMTARLHDAFSMFGTGVFKKEDLEGTLDESFGYFADYYNNIGGLADASFTRIIALSREAGAESAAVTEYVNAQVMTAATGLEMYLENATVKTQSAASGIGGAMVLMFNEIRSGPEGLRGAIDTLGPMILAFQEQMTSAGLTAGDTFQGMLDYVRAFEVEGVGAAVTAVDGLTMTLEGLYNATLLNAEVFSGLSRAMTDEIEVARQALIAQGQDGDKALQLNAAGLQTIWELQKQYGWAVDESTQAMLDQAEAQGLIGKEFMDTNLQMLDALERAATALERMAEGFGFVADAAEGAGEVIDEATRPRTVPIDFEMPDGRTPWDEGFPGPNGYSRGGYVRPRYAAMGMFVPRGTDTVPAMLTPGEGVLSRRGMRALGALNEGGMVGGGHTFNLTIHAGDRQGGRDAAEGFLETMKQRGVKMTAAA